MGELFTVGEVFDKLKKGQYAISRSDEDKETLLSIDHERWFFIVHPHREYKRYGINLQANKCGIEKRWEIREIDDYFMSEIEGLVFKD